MSGHDVIVIGASAGGVQALTRLIGNLSPTINAAIFIVLHVPADKPSSLPKILQRVSDFPCSHAVEGETIQHGKIYIAPPDFHLLVKMGHVHVVRGPQENRFRPAIDALFRSAALAYGPAVLGVLLTGALDDGTVGAQDIKSRGGLTIVQDPEEAEFPFMPRNASKYVEVDHCVKLSEMAALLLRLSNEPARERDYPISKEILFESNIAEQNMNTQEFLDNVEEIGRRTTYTCPECQGSIWQIGNSEPLRFRCHVGHSFTAEPFLGEQTQHIENLMWSTVRALEEKVTLLRQISDRMNRRGDHLEATQFGEYAEKVDSEVYMVRELILNGFATRRNVIEEQK
jgi:two-component system, chemotaxis family, protein-glutamate methylesterase/glutaminase